LSAITGGQQEMFDFRISGTAICIKSIADMQAPHKKPLSDSNQPIDKSRKGWAEPTQANLHLKYTVIMQVVLPQVTGKDIT